MQTYVINLARSPDRRAHILAQLGNTRVQYEIVNAVDGRELNLTETELVDPAFAKASAARPGVIGCALSHLEVYRRIIDEGHEQACVLEDDVVLPADLDILIDAITPYLSGADVVFLNFQSHEPCRVTKAGAMQLPSSRLLVHVVDEQQVRSTGGYVITREACLRMTKTVPPVRVLADEWAFFSHEGAIDRLRCVVPMPVAQSTSLRTTMSYYEPGSLYARVRESVASSNVSILRWTLGRRRNRMMSQYANGRTEFVDGIS